MARLRGHRSLDVDSTLYTMRSLTIGSTDFAAGAVFSWRDLGLSPRKVLQLWQQRRIGHEQRDERNGAEDQGVLVKRFPVASERADVAQPKSGKSKAQRAAAR